jgi:hypothetical protein
MREQVKSLQEENGRLQKQKVNMPKDSRLEEDLVQTIEELKCKYATLQKEHEHTLSQKSLLEQENRDLVEALSVRVSNSPVNTPDSHIPFSPPRPDARQQHTSQPARSQSPVSDEDAALDAMFDQSIAEIRKYESPADLRQAPPTVDGVTRASGAVRVKAEAKPETARSASQNRSPSPHQPQSPGERLARGRGAAQEQKRPEQDGQAWRSESVWASGCYRQQVHGIAVSRDDRTLGDAGVVSWDGTCSLLRATEGLQGGRMSFEPVWSVSPGKGLYAVAFGEVGGGDGGRGWGSCVLGVASMDRVCYVLSARDGSTLYTFRGGVQGAGF